MFKKIIIFLFVVGLIGCSKPTDKLKPLTLSEAEERLASLLTDEHKLVATVKPLTRTLWVYVALEDDLLRFKASERKKSFAPTDAHDAMSLRFLDGQFEDDIFKIQYDIGMNRAYNKDYGYTTDYNPRLQEIQQNILTAIHRVYSEVDSGATSPNFVVITIADITSGLRTEMTAALTDIKRAFVDQGFGEEYVRRMISGYPTGDANIINDAKGENLELKDYTWGEFLIKQIVYRIQFKYTRSAFPPSENTKYEIFKEAQTVVNNYSFEDFDSIELTNLVSSATNSMNRDELLSLPIDEASQPKIYHMKFDLPTSSE